MNDSMAHPVPRSGLLELPTWKAVVDHGAAIILSALFLVAGIWRIIDPVGAAMRMLPSALPYGISLGATITLGIAETYTAVLLLVPYFRRWGAWLAGLQLLAFLIYIGSIYGELRDKGCNCFPWLSLTVAPPLFVAVTVLLLLAVVVGWWSRPFAGRRGAVLVLGVVAVFGMVSYGISATRMAWVSAPESIIVEGAPYSLQRGRVFLFFFETGCRDCEEAARALAGLKWGETGVVGVTADPQSAVEFLRSTGLAAVLSADLELLREAFPFVSVPYAVALEDGLQRASFAGFGNDQFPKSLRRMGFVSR